MKFAQAIYSTGMPHLVKLLIKHPDNMLKIFICSIVVEETDAFHIGDWKEEFLSSIQKLSKHIGLYLRNGEDLNIKEFKNGG